MCVLKNNALNYRVLEKRKKKDKIQGYQPRRLSFFIRKSTGNLGVPVRLFKKKETSGDELLFIFLLEISAQRTQLVRYSVDYILIETVKHPFSETVKIG